MFHQGDRAVLLGPEHEERFRWGFADDMADLVGMEVELGDPIDGGEGFVVFDPIHDRHWSWDATYLAEPAKQTMTVEAFSDLFD